MKQALTLSRIILLGACMTCATTDAATAVTTPTPKSIYDYEVKKINGAQEPGSNAEIKNFCERKFKVSFPLFEKAPVSGNKIQPLYAYLVENAPTKGAVGWNFEKFLVGKDGKIIGRYKSSVAPESEELTKAIEAALKAKI